MALEWGNTAAMPPLWARTWLYGPPGSGKTTAAACFPKPFFIFVHNEDSETTLRGSDYNYVKVGKPEPGTRAGEPVAVRADTEKMMDALLALDQTGELHDKAGQTIVFDNLTHYNDLVLAELQAMPTGRNGKGAGKMDDSKWGLLRQHFLHIRDVLWRLRAHVVLVSFATVRKADRVVIGAGPAVAGSAGDLLPGCCSALGYCETEQGHRVVYFTQRGLYPARHRLRGMSEGPIANHELWRHMAPCLGHGG